MTTTPSLSRRLAALTLRLPPVWLGLLTTVLALVVADLCARRGIVLDMPGAVFLVAVMASAYLGGVRAGLASAVLTLGYAVLPWAAASPRAVAPESAPLRLLTLVVLIPATAVLVGLLRDRAERRLRDLRRTVAELDEANLRLKQLTLVDGLTGIGNRRCFDEALATEWIRAVRSGAQLALLVVDVDHFKAYNDRYGHLQGDAALRRVAQALSETVYGPRTLVARYGGEEFAVLLPETDQRGALVVAEQIRLAVVGLRVEHRAGAAGPWLTVSVGAAVVHPEDGTGSTVLVSEADAALYLAKQAGRNGVHPAPAY